MIACYHHPVCSAYGPGALSSLPTRLAGPQAALGILPKAWGSGLVVCSGANVGGRRNTDTFNPSGR